MNFTKVISEFPFRASLHGRRHINSTYRLKYKLRLYRLKCFLGFSHDALAATFVSQTNLAGVKLYSVATVFFV